MKIFIDTSALIAYYNADDRHHGEAAEVMGKIEGGEIPLTRFYITDYVFDETMTFMECVLKKHRLAMDVGKALLSSPFTTMLRIYEEDFQGAWSRFAETKNVSFTDCSSFSVMERLGITHAFTFDRHFREAGFKTLH